MEVQIFNTSGNKPIGTLDTLRNSSTIKDVKRGVQRLKSNLYPDRQSIRLDPKGKTLKDDETLQSLGLKSGGKLYVKDLGPQIGWVTVFLAEYAGPLFIYLWFYQRPWLFYGNVAQEAHNVVQLASLATSVYTWHFATSDHQAPLCVRSLCLHPTLSRHCSTLSLAPITHMSSSAGFHLP